MKEAVPLSVCVIIAALAATSTAQAASCDGLDGVRGLACHVDRERADHGLPPLRSAPTLARAARRHADDMVERGYFAHMAPDGERVGDRVRAAGYLRGRPRWWVGECLAWGSGSRSTPEGIVRMWMASPPHRRLVLSRRAREAGFGLAVGGPKPTARPAVTVAFVLGRR